MIIEVTMKTPDALEMAVQGIDDEEQQQDEAREALSKWFRWGEYVDLRFDTEAGTAEVIKQKE